MGRAFKFFIFTLYIYYINLNWVKGSHFAELYLHCCERDRLVRLIFAY